MEPDLPKEGGATSGQVEPDQHREGGATQVRWSQTSTKKEGPHQVRWSQTSTEKVDEFAQDLESSIGLVHSGAKHCLIQVFSPDPKESGTVPLGKLLKAFTTSALEICKEWG